MKKVSKNLAIVLIVTMLFTSFAFAHSGRTDSQGGHRDNNNVSGLGYYHYHCGGNPAHLHPGGVCPYRSSSGSSYSGEKFTTSVGRVARLSEPTNVKATSVSGGIKITFKGVRNGKSYLIYRAASKNGKYTKIGSTTKKTYYDYSASINKTYYYRVKAYNQKYKTSLFSHYASAKWKKIKNIEYEWVSELYEQEPIALGEARWIDVHYNRNRDITAYYDDEWLDVKWDGDQLYVSCEKTSPSGRIETIDIKYDGLPDSYGISIPVFIEAYITNTRSDYVEFAGVPEFGSELGISPDFVNTVSGFRAYMYNFSSIENVGEKPLVYMYSYILELESRGFYLIEKTPIETGTYHLYTNGTRQVSVQNVEQGELKGIIIGVK